MKYLLPAVLLAAFALTGCDVLVSPDRRVERAAAMIDDGDYRGAAIELRRALQKEPAHAEGRLLMARTSLWLGDVAGADKELQRAREAGMPAERLVATDARIRLMQGDAEGVAAMLAAQPAGLDEWERLALLGEAQLALGQSGPALESFTAAAAAAPDARRKADARASRAEALVAGGDVAGAMQELEAVLRDDPGNQQAAARRGGLLLGQGRHAEAIEALAPLLAKPDGRQLDVRDQVIAAVSLAEAQLALARYDEAGKTVDGLAKVAAGSPLIPYVRGRIALAQGRTDEAVTLLQKSAAAAPAFLQARLMLAVALLGQGSFAQAETELREVIAAAPDNVEARKLLAQAEIRQGRGQSASEVLSPALAADSEDSGLLVLAGQAKVLEGDREAGVALLERGLAQSGDDPQARLDIAASYLASGDRQRAIETLATVPDDVGGPRKRQMLFLTMATGKDREVAKLEIEQLIKRNPKDVDLLNMAAGWLSAQGEAQAARGYLTQALAIDPRNARALVTLGRLEGSQRRVEESRKAFEAALAADPKTADAYLGLHLLAEAQGDRAAARRWLERWAEADPKAPFPRIMLARFAFRASDPTQARKLIDAALAAAPNDATVEAAVAQVLLEAAAYDEALNHFRKASEINPGNPNFLLGAARAQLALNQREAARDSLSRALALQPHWVPAAALLATVEMSGKRYSAALAVAERLKTNAPTAAAGHALEGDIRMAMDEPEAAMSAYAQSARVKPSSEAARGEYAARVRARHPRPAEPLQLWLAANPQDVVSRLLLGQHLESTGDADGAIAAYELVLRSAPGSPVALNNLAWLYAQRKDPRAEGLARKALAAAPQAPAIKDTLGWILVRDGSNVPEGLTLLRQAHEGAPDNPEIAYHLGVALVKSGQVADGRRMIEAALAEADAAPWAPEARKWLADDQ